MKNDGPYEAKSEFRVPIYDILRTDIDQFDLSERENGTISFTKAKSISFVQKSKLTAGSLLQATQDIVLITA